MKNETNYVPIGQGCKFRHTYLDVDHKKPVSRCKEHFWLYLNVCMGCGEKFHSNRPNVKTCSDKCRKRLSRLRHDTVFQTVMKLTDGGG
jgi:hypothetical protein